MDNNLLEKWMHATDEERNAIQSQWKVNQGEGREIIEKISDIFKQECVYNILEVAISNKKEVWEIDAYVSNDDYISIKNRYYIRFLGLDINFYDIASYN